MFSNGKLKSDLSSGIAGDLLPFQGSVHLHGGGGCAFHIVVLPHTGGKVATASRRTRSRRGSWTVHGTTPGRTDWAAWATCSPLAYGSQDHQCCSLKLDWYEWYSPPPPPCWKGRDTFSPREEMLTDKPADPPHSPSEDQGLAHKVDETLTCRLGFCLSPAHLGKAQAVRFLPRTHMLSSLRPLGVPRHSGIHICTPDVQLLPSACV